MKNSHVDDMLGGGIDTTIDNCTVDYFQIGICGYGPARITMKISNSTIGADTMRPGALRRRRVKLVPAVTLERVRLVTAKGIS
jgi:hypothetical protein